MARPFQRAWREPRVAEAHGSDESHALARALAETADPLFIQSVIDAKAALDRFGGELFIGTDRRKFNRDGEEINQGVGDFETVGYAFHWNSRTQIGKVEESREEVVAEVEAAPNGEGDHETAEEVVESAAGS
jgi:hypothetical protein